MVNSDINIDRRRWLERYPDLRIVDSPPKGVYPAFNDGVANATGDFVYFLGDSDLILPGMLDLIRKVTHPSGRIDVAVALVLDQWKGVQKNYHSKYSLIYNNWPHQGMLFRRGLFKLSLFNPRYRVQGDHHLNILFAGNPEVTFSHFREVVAYFCRGGISTTQIDTIWREEMPSVISSSFGPFSGLLCRLRRFAGTIRNLLRK